MRKEQVYVAETGKLVSEARGDGQMYYVDPFKLVSEPRTPSPYLDSEVEDVVATFQSNQDSLNHPCANKADEFGATSVNFPLRTHELS